MFLIIRLFQMKTMLKITNIWRHYLGVDLSYHVLHLKILFVRHLAY